MQLTELEVRRYCACSGVSRICADAQTMVASVAGGPDAADGSAWFGQWTQQVDAKSDISRPGAQPRPIESESSLLYGALVVSEEYLHVRITYPPPHVASRSR